MVRLLQTSSSEGNTKADKEIGQGCKSMKQMKSPNHSKLANEEIRMDVEIYKIGKD